MSRRPEGTRAPCVSRRSSVSIIAPRALGQVCDRTGSSSRAVIDAASCSGVAGREEQSRVAVPDEQPRARDVRGDHGNPGGHGLHDAPGNALVEGRQDEHVETLEDGERVVTVSDEDATRPGAAARRACLERFRFGTVPRDDQPHGVVTGVQAGEGVDEAGHVLVGRQTAHVADQELVGDCVGPGGAASTASTSTAFRIGRIRRAGTRPGGAPPRGDRGQADRLRARIGGSRDPALVGDRGPCSRTLPSRVASRRRGRAPPRSRDPDDVRLVAVGVEKIDLASPEPPRRRITPRGLKRPPVWRSIAVIPRAAGLADQWRRLARLVDQVYDPVSTLFRGQVAAQRKDPAFGAVDAGAPDHVRDPDRSRHRDEARLVELRGKRCRLRAAVNSAVTRALARRVRAGPPRPGGQEPDQSGRRGAGRVAHGDEQPGVLVVHDLDVAADPRGHDRPTGLHRLQHREGHRLRDRGQGEHVASRQQSRGRPASPQEPDAAVESEVRPPCAAALRGTPDRRHPRQEDRSWQCDRITSANAGGASRTSLTRCRRPTVRTTGVLPHRCRGAAAPGRRSSIRPGAREPVGDHRDPGRGHPLERDQALAAELRHTGVGGGDEAQELVGQRPFQPEPVRLMTAVLGEHDPDSEG